MKLPRGASASHLPHTRMHIAYVQAHVHAHAHAYGASPSHQALASAIVLAPLHMCMDMYMHMHQALVSGIVLAALHMCMHMYMHMHQALASVIVLAAVDLLTHLLPYLLNVLTYLTYLLTYQALASAAVLAAALAVTCRVRPSDCTARRVESLWASSSCAHVHACRHVHMRIVNCACAYAPQSREPMCLLQLRTCTCV